jgi:hypothetical protein
MYPYAALDTTKIHTFITLGIRHPAKALVFEPRKRRPFGFDSHRPLHFQDRSGHVGTRDSSQGSDPLRKRWERVDLATVSCPHLSPSCPSIHTNGHTQQFPRTFCVNPKLASADGGFSDPQWETFSRPQYRSGGRPHRGILPHLFSAPCQKGFSTNRP